MNRGETKIWNETVYKRASNVIDLCAELEDIMFELIPASKDNSIRPIFIDADTKKHAMESIGHLAALIALIQDNE
jgi:hypothetical protein